MQVAFKGWKQGRLLRAGSCSLEVSGRLDSGNISRLHAEAGVASGESGPWPGGAEVVCPAGGEPAEAGLR